MEIARILRWWLRCEPVVVRTTRETTFEYGVENLQARHTYVRDPFNDGADVSDAGHAQQ